MSGKLDQSLDQIMQDSKPAGGAGGRGGRIRRPARRAAAKAKAAIAAPVGGVQKKTRADTRPARARATNPVLTAPVAGDSKIIVSNLPEDVSETMIKDYFGQTIGHVKRATLTYGPTGKSRGVATIIFSNAAAGAKAATQLDGVKVDNKPMKVEVVLGAKQTTAPSAPKGLADRMSQPKSAVNKRANPTKQSTVKTGSANKANGTAATNGADRAKGGRRGGKAGRAGRPKKKTAQELDAEMMDYFGGGENPANGAAAQPAATATATANGGDAGMVDDVA